MSDKLNEESGCYDEKPSKFKCKICCELILQSMLKLCDQGDGTYICPACQHDANADKLREKMGRD